MLIDLKSLHRKYQLKVNGVLHLGAHYGEEADDYDRLHFGPVYWIEADDSSIPELTKNVGSRTGHTIVQAVVAEEAKIVTFNQANNGQSSSILEFGTHSKEHPDVVFTGQKSMMATTLDELEFLGFIEKVNFMNLDIQGAELMALQGGVDYLSDVQYIYTEVNQKELYKGCCLLKDLDHWLGQRGFSRVELEMTQHGWGDAFYVR